MRAWKKCAIVGLVCLVLVTISIPVWASTFPSNETLQQLGEYPYFLEPFSDNELQLFKQEFESINTPPICNNLDEYGYVSKMRSRDCQRHKVAPSKLLLTRSNDEIIEMIRHILIKNSKFTGVTNNDNLVSKRVIISKGCFYRCMGCSGLPNCTVVKDAEDVDRIPLSLIVKFENQFYKDIEVANTQLGVTADERGIISISGHYYYNISVPTTPSISEKEAIEIARNATNAPETAKPYYLNLTILPKKEDISLTYYLTWHVQIWATDVFVDAVNGEVVEQFSVVPSSPSPQTPEPTVTTPHETTEAPTYQPEITETPVITPRPPIQQPVNNESVKDVQGRPSANAGVILILILIGVVGLVLLKRRESK